MSMWLVLAFVKVFKLKNGCFEGWGSSQRVDTSNQPLAQIALYCSLTRPPIHGPGSLNALPVTHKCAADLSDNGPVYFVSRGTVCDAYIMLMCADFVWSLLP